MCKDYISCKMGYGAAGGLEGKLNILKQLFVNLCPHEVGIFLGIPLEDVEGFLKNKWEAELYCQERKGLICIA